MKTIVLFQLIQVTNPTETFHSSSCQMTQTALLSIMFVAQQVEQNAEEEVRQYMNNEVDDILYFEDRAVFSLNAVDVSAVVIMQSNDIHTLYNYII